VLACLTDRLALGAYAGKLRAQRRARLVLTALVKLVLRFLSVITRVLPGPFMRSGVTIRAEC
jgi:hypothetical protein